MAFYALRKENGGCDYTIGCGLDLWLLDAETLEEALLEVEGGVDLDDDSMDEDDLHDALCDSPLKSSHGYLASCTIFEVTATHEVDIPAFKRRVEAAQARISEAATKAQELAEFERLKAKLGK